MIPRATEFGTGVGRFSRPLREVGVIAIPDAELDTMQQVAVLSGAGVLQRPVPRRVVGVFIARRSVADGVEVTCWVMSATQKLFSEEGWSFEHEL